MTNVNRADLMNTAEIIAYTKPYLNISGPITQNYSIIYEDQINKILYVMIIINEILYLMIKSNKV